MRIIETKVYTIDEHPNPDLCFDWTLSDETIKAIEAIESNARNAARLASKFIMD